MVTQSLRELPTLAILFFFRKLPSLWTIVFPHGSGSLRNGFATNNI
jgi:hypothetical protein